MGPASIAAASVRSVRSILSGSTDRSTRQASPVGDLVSDSSGNDSDSDSESESDSDSESVFIYTRVTRLPPTFFRKDAVSACYISKDVHIYGTHSGIVHLCKPDSTPIRTVRVHRSSVLDIDSNGSEFVATASIDGTVVIAAIADQSDLIQASFRRPVHAIALHPDYRGFRSYISGGTAGQVVLSERGWLKSRSDTVLAQTQSTILAISWPIPSRLIWCNEDGITLYNPESRNVINRISRGPHSPRADLFRPRIHIHDDSAIIAWHRSIHVVNIHSGELVNTIECVSPLAGAIPFHGMQQFAVLAVDKQQPEIKLIDSSTSQETYEDELELNGGPRLGVNDYHLALGDSSKLWIVSSDDAVIARERTARDHVDWLLDHHRYTDAYSASKLPQAGVDSNEQKQLGLKAAQQLVSLGKWHAASYILSEILAEDRAEWLMWSTQFLKENQHLILGDILPNIELSGVHDSVLDVALAERDVARLSTWVHNWPLDIFDANALAAKIAQATQTDSQRGNNTALKEVLANLWLRLDEHTKAVHEFVEIDSPRAFDVVSHYHLWTEPEVENILGSVLSSGDGEGGTGGYVDRLRELIQCRAEITPSRVVHQLEREGSTAENGGQDLLLFGYLTELGLVDETCLGDFADLMVRLYAKYDPQKLLGFLERFDTYDIDATIDLCRKQELDNELVYLLGCVGKPQESLQIMVEKLQDYEHAVSFARTQGPEVWDTLISYCSEHPGLVLALLKCVEVSPARVLAMVPESMHITGLKQALCKVLNNQEVSLELNEGALAIVQSELLQWMRILRARRLKGTEIADPDSIDWEDPLLVSETGQEKVSSKGPVTTFAGKIGHLRWLLGL